MNRVFFITLMAMICHVSLAQDTDSTSKLREGKEESIVTINGTDKEGKPKTTRVRVNFVRHSKNAYFGIDPTLEFGWNRFMTRRHWSPGWRHGTGAKWTSSAMRCSMSARYCSMPVTFNKSHVPARPCG